MDDTREAITKAIQEFAKDIEGMPDEALPILQDALLEALMELRHEMALRQEAQE